MDTLRPTGTRFERRAGETARQLIFNALVEGGMSLELAGGLIDLATLPGRLPEHPADWLIEDEAPTVDPTDWLPEDEPFAGGDER